MQQHKCGNGKRKPRRREKKQQAREAARLSLHTHDPITGNQERLSSLFYEYYRGYTIYSNERGRCSIHGKDGCLRIAGKYVAFPNIEQAKRMIKYFRAEGYSSQESMDRSVSEGAYRCLNRGKSSEEPGRYQHTGV